MVGERIPVLVSKIEDPVTGKTLYKKQCSECGYGTDEYPTLKQADREIDQHLRDEHGFGEISTHRAGAKDVRKGERNLAKSDPLGLGDNINFFRSPFAGESLSAFDFGSQGKRKLNIFSLLDDLF